MEWNAIGVVLMGVVQMAALIRAYYGLKADNAELASKIALALLTEQSDRTRDNVTLKESVMTAIWTVESIVKDLTHRVTALESGQDDWTKSLRTRTHELANQMNSLALKIDRLERPAPGDS